MASFKQSVTQCGAGSVRAMRETSSMDICALRDRGGRIPRRATRDPTQVREIAVAVLRQQKGRTLSDPFQFSCVIRGPRAGPLPGTPRSTGNTPDPLRRNHAALTSAAPVCELVSGPRPRARKHKLRKPSVPRARPLPSRRHCVSRRIRCHPPEPSQRCRPGRIS